jgi:hypothetical protein
MPRKNAHYRGIANTPEDNVARKEFLLNQPEEDVVDEDEVFEEVEGEEDDDEYDEFDWTTE